ncbi:MAG: hypothetical protein ACFFE4_08705 [Candidatus Thorarchaeota archaeon]
MSIFIKLYGDLINKVPHNKIGTGIPNTLTIEINNLTTILEILEDLKITDEEISHIFVNGIYSGVGKLVKAGDRVGIFPRRMGIMFLEITQIKSIYVKVVLHEGLGEFGPVESILDLAEGSSIKTILKKYRISQNKSEIVINGKPIHNVNYILRDWDNVAIFPL